MTQRKVHILEKNMASVHFMLEKKGVGGRGGQAQCRSAGWDDMKKDGLKAGAGKVPF